jgi:hypothetical protein
MQTVPIPNPVFEPLSNLPEGTFTNEGIQPHWIPAHCLSRAVTENYRRPLSEQKAQEEVPEEDPPALLPDGSRPTVVYLYPHPTFRFYAVSSGRQIGVFDNFAETEAATKSFPGASFRRFPTYREAVRWFDDQFQDDA